MQHKLARYWFPEKRLAKLLELRPYERPVMLIAVGYADENGGIPYSQKRDRSFSLGMWCSDDVAIVQHGERNQTCAFETRTPEEAGSGMLC